METSLSINKFPVGLVILLLLGLVLIAVTQAVMELLVAMAELPKITGYSVKVIAREKGEYKV